MGRAFVKWLDVLVVLRIARAQMDPAELPWPRDAADPITQWPPGGAGHSFGLGWLRRMALPRLAWLVALPQGGGLRGRGAWPGKGASGRGVALGPAEGGGVAIGRRARRGPSAEAGRFLGGK